MAVSIQCHLFRLPSELRLRIYELVLSFVRPIKIRQTVPGSENTAVLRANKQIFTEALPVLFDANQISVTLNDFCEKTDDSLKSPVPRQHVRHMLVTAFGESIACNFALDRCSVCDVTSSGFLEVLWEMPRLKTVMVDFRTHVGNFTRFKYCFAHQHQSRVRLECQSIGLYRLVGQDSGAVDIRFCHDALYKTWARIEEAWSHMPDIEETTLAETQALEICKKIDGDMPDKLWLLFCLDKYGILDMYFGDVAARWQAARAVEQQSDATSYSTALDGLTHAVLVYVASITAPGARLLLHQLRVERDVVRLHA